MSKHGTEIHRMETLDGRYKGTVEERKDGTYIATLWDRELDHEVDRKVVEFETYSGALVHMYEGLFTLAKDALKKSREDYEQLGYELQNANERD